MFTPRVLRKGFVFADIAIELLDEEWTATEDYDRAVDEAWRDKLAQARHPLWDGLHYRLADIGDFSIFRLGTVRYRYVATYSRLDALHASLGLAPFHHLTTFALPQTIEGDYAFGRRASNGEIDFIGGGVQKDEIAVSRGADLEANLFKEMEEEIGIPRDAVAGVTGLGIIMSGNSNILMASHVALRLSRSELEDRFARRPDEEMSELVFVPPGELRSFLGGLPGYRSLVPGLL